MRNFIISLIEWISVFFKKYFRSENRNLPYIVAIIIAAIFFVMALNAFVEITDELAENELGAADETVTGYVTSFRSDGLTSFFTFMTHMGDRFAYIVIGLLVALYFFLRHRSWKFILQAILVLMLSTASNIMLKRVINRQRPVAEHLVSVDTLSYPSGHSMSAMAFYGFLIYLTLVLKGSRRAKAVVIAVLIFIIVCVGLSRVYLGVHYPSDVAAGFMGGLIWVTFCVILFNVVSLLRRRKGIPPSVV